MTDIFLVIQPLIFLVVTGMALAKSGLITGTDWQSIEKLSFRVLIPALIIHSIYRSDLSLQTSGPFVAAMFLTIVVIGLTAIPLRKAMPHRALSNASLSSIFQVITRWNAFIVLPVASQLFGTQGLTAVAIAMAFLIPLINIVNIAVISSLLASRVSLAQLGGRILKNPMVISSIIGLTLNYSGIDPGATVETTLSLLSSGAVAIGLLCIGASFDWHRLLAPGWQVIWGVVVKNILSPALFFAMAAAFNLGQLETLCGMLVVSAPAATNGYIVARQMGGDGDLYAHTLSWQLVASIVTIPILISMVFAA